jgi:arylsulfatase A-like enzyme
VAGARAARDLGFTTILLHHGPDQPYGMVRRHKFEQFVAAHPDGPLIPLKGNDAMTAYALAPPAESVIETPLAPRLPVATVVGEVRRREEAIVLPPGGRAVFYLPLEVGSRLRGWVESGTGVLEVADESGEGIPLEIAPGPVDLDLSPFDGELLRIALEGGATGARWRDLRMVAPAPRVYPSAIPRARHDVLMILLDSLRADEIEGAGGVVGLTPTIAALADGGVRFDEARAPASWTRPSVASLLSSVSPTTHQISLLVEALPEGMPSLPEQLSAAGYLTAALTHSSQVTSNVGFERGFDRFERFYAPETYARFQALTTPAERAEGIWREGLAPVLEAAGERPWFVYLHELDPHYPYEPPSPFDTRYAEGEHPKSLPTTPDAYMREGFDRADLDRLRGLYRGEIGFMDEFLAELLARLREAQGERDTLIVFLSDHGEAFGEHGQLGHALVLHENQLRVPLLMRLDGVLPAGVRIPTTVDLVDVAPTLLDLLGLEAAEGMQGRSLVPLIEGVAESESPRSFVAESLAGFQAALRLGRWKLVRDAWSASDASISKSGAPWLSISQIVAIEDVDVAATPLVYSLYDLSSDPGEERDLVAERPFVAAALGQLLAWERHRLAPGEPARDVSVDALGADELEHLKALGYVE